MTSLLIILGLSLGLGLLLTPVARAAALCCGLVDRPDGLRKMHSRPIPVAGGVAVLAAACLALVSAMIALPEWKEPLATNREVLIGLLLAALVIAAVGVADDYVGLRGRHKLLGQMVAVGIVMASGVMVRHIRIFDWQVELGLLAIPFTGFWLLGAINALNLLDGMDGMLGCVGAIICLGLAALASAGGQWAAAGVAAALGGALLGFLCFNLPPASIFLGDSGSMLVGLVVGVLAITCSLKGPATVALATPLALLVIPIFDTLAAILRRKLTGRSIYTVDRGHIHHCLLRLGLSNQRALVVVSVLCVLTVLGTLASLALNSESLAVGSALLVVLILVATRVFGHAELLLVKQRFLGLVASFLHRVPDGPGRQSEVRLQGSGDWQELWRSLRECAQEMKLQSVRLDVNAPFLHEGYHARWDRSGPDLRAQMLWQADIPLVADGRPVGRLEVSGTCAHGPIGAKLARIAQLAEEVEAAILRLSVGQTTLLAESLRTDSALGGMPVLDPAAEASPG